MEREKEKEVEKKMETERRRKAGERELSTSNFHTCAETSRTYTKETRKK